MLQAGWSISVVEHDRGFAIVVGDTGWGREYAHRKFFVVAKKWVISVPAVTGSFGKAAEDGERSDECVRRGASGER